MLSLANAFSDKDILDFHERINASWTGGMMSGLY